MTPQNDKPWDGSERRTATVQPKVPDNITLEDIWLLLQAHTQEMEIFRTRVERGFPKNKYQEPDFDAHAEYHEKILDEAVKISARNERLAEKFLGGGIWATIVVLGTWMASGALEWLKAHLK